MNRPCEPRTNKIPGPNLAFGVKLYGIWLAHTLTGQVGMAEFPV